MEYPIPQSSNRSAAESPVQGYRTEGGGTERKRLGQYFTSMPLSRLLATLAIDGDIRTVLDPMCGDGSLLEAAALVASSQGISLEQVDGMELDPVAARRCAERLTKWAPKPPPHRTTIVSGNAFDPASIDKLPLPAYDLVIANPPYVRYQALTRSCESTSSPDASQIRDHLTQIAAERGHFWSCLARGYSGHADLSVPSWLLSAMLVAPGGRLALVVPATWQSREYGDILRYLMARAFSVELIVEDSQPGWFSDALVRTNLLVARRHAGASIPPLGGSRRDVGIIKRLIIAPEAASGESVVGKTFAGAFPERDLTEWLAGRCDGELPGIALRSTARAREVQWLKSHSGGRRWYIALEGKGGAAFPPNGSSIPEPLLDCLQGDVGPTRPLGELEGVSVGQGLRTGCNGFFYVDALVEGGSSGHCLIESALFPGRVFEVPGGVLKPVLRRQSELAALAKGATLPGRLLDLRGWALDSDALPLASGHRQGLRIMANGLARYVRAAAGLALGSGAAVSRIPLLSAVRTNVRAAKGASPPGFWYAIPDLMPRHLPDLFVPRVSNRSPLVLSNTPDPLVIDANFSTFTVAGSDWTSAALFAFLRSTWSLACMELLGTRMGGGALKLEAAQLRKLPVPPLRAGDIQRLHRLGRTGTQTEEMLSEVDGIILESMMVSGRGTASIRQRLVALCERQQAQRRN